MRPKAHSKPPRGTLALITVLGFAMCIALVGAVSHGSSQEPKKGGPKPRLIVAEPMGIAAGTDVKVALRGLNLNGVTEIRCHEPKSRCKLIGVPKKIPVPNPGMLAVTGDMQCEAELRLPSELAGREVLLSAVGPNGESDPLRVLVLDERPHIAEKEPNDGFANPQRIALPAVILGSISRPQDVDTYALECRTGDRITVRLRGPRFGSALDPLITMFDAAGQILATSTEARRDCDTVLHVTATSACSMHLVIMDANDQGGPTHVYRLEVTSER